MADNILENRKFNKVRESLRVLFRKSTQECESTWVGPTPTLMGLPVEVRLMIYDYIFPEILDIAWTFNPETSVHFCGALALLHTNRVLRAECQDMFVLLLLKRQHQRLNDDLDYALHLVPGSPNQWHWLEEDATFYYHTLERLTCKYVKVRGRKLKKVELAWKTKHVQTLEKIVEHLESIEADTQSGRKKLWRWWPF